MFRFGTDSTAAMFLTGWAGCGRIPVPPLFLQQRRCHSMRHYIATLWPHVCDLLAVVIDLLEMI